MLLANQKFENFQVNSADDALTTYLRGPRPHCLEIGAGANSKRGWLATDLRGRTEPDGTVVLALDATKEFDIPSDSFDFVYSEHMIEHIGFDDGQTMLSECNRILRVDGIIRIVTPSIEFLLKIISANRTALEESYRNWSVRTFVREAPEVTNAFFLNNFMRAWDHTFIYDEETLRLAMTQAGFEPVTKCELNASNHAPLRDLENAARLPPGFLNLESMIFEGVKAVPNQTLAGRNLALGRPATQSSISQWSRADTPEQDASRATSGNLSGTYNFHTDLDDRPWWRVDLERSCIVRGVRIFNRIAERGVMARANQFEIQISQDDDSWQTVFQKTDDRMVRGITIRSPFIWTADPDLRARFVRIQLLGRQFLHLDQVEVIGEPVDEHGSVPTAAK